MSDNLGPNQSRVIDPTDRNFESVVYQYHKPPLSSEANLVNALSSEQVRDVQKSAMPSGWEVLGQIRDNISESVCVAGDVVCSPNYPANSFRLLALDQGINPSAERLVAWVNGYKIVIQGTNSLSDENNTITLQAPPTIAYNVNFVFLEVWRELISPTSVIYKHGNVLYGGTNPTNDLIDPLTPIETSRRIQVQYRIRVVPNFSVTAYPEGFDPATVYAQGPNPLPLTTSIANFYPVPGDPGLYRAGLGDTASQTILGTIDGFIYAIPMFAVSRRNTLPYDPFLKSNGARYTLADFLVGTASDRPDGLYNNLIVANDIHDLRHRISPSFDYKAMADDAFSRLINGQLHSKLQEDLVGEDHFGKVLLQADTINPDLGWPNRIASADGLRRVFSNAQTDQSSTLCYFLNTQKYVGSTGIWDIGDQVLINISSYPSGTQVLSVQGAWMSNGAQVTNYTIGSVPLLGTTLAINAGSSAIGLLYPIVVDCTLRFPSGPYGLNKLPDQFLEARDSRIGASDATCAIALTSQGTRVHGAPPVVTDQTRFDMLYNFGGNSTEAYNFGHQIVHHIASTGVGTTIYYVPRNLYGYQLMGVVQVTAGGVPWTNTVSRDANNYAITMLPGVPSNTDIAVTFYVGGKFFQMNRQGKAILDTFEMVTLTTAGDGLNSSFTMSAPNDYSQTLHFNTTSQIQAFASNAVNNGVAMAYVSTDGTNYAQTSTQVVTNNSGLPTDTTKSMATFQFVAPPAGGTAIEIPTLLKRPLLDSTSLVDAYTFFYNTTPYQGILDSSAAGTVLARGPAIITTAGSGLVSDYSYTTGTANFTLGSTVITGVGTGWVSGARAGYVIQSDSTSSLQYMIAAVSNDNTIIVSSPVNFTQTNAAYHIIGRDIPAYPPANIVDKLPIISRVEETKCQNDQVSTAVTDQYPTLNTRVVSEVQDVIGLPPNALNIGTATAYRGLSGLAIAGAQMGAGTIGLKFEKIDAATSHEVYQSYLVEGQPGRIYLMVVGSESDGTSNTFDPISGSEAVDLFELPDRPIKTMS